MLNDSIFAEINRKMIVEHRCSGEDFQMLKTIKEAEDIKDQLRKNNVMQKGAYQ